MSIVFFNLFDFYLIFRIFCFLNVLWPSMSTKFKTGRNFLPVLCCFCFSSCYAAGLEGKYGYAVGRKRIGKGVRLPVAFGSLRFIDGLLLGTASAVFRVLAV